MGLNYVDSIIIYNEYKSRRPEAQYYFGTRLDNVRIELTQGENITKSGLENANVCLAKIHKTNLPKPYLVSEAWRKKTTEEMIETFTLNKGKDFFVIVKRKGLNIDIDDLPVGMIESDAYAEGWFDYVKNKYGYAFTIDTISDYEVEADQTQSRFEIGGN